MVRLNWLLLEHRIRYYVLDTPVIEDLEYDKLERLFLDYCEEQKISSCLQTMVGADMSLPCMQQAYNKVLQG